MGSGKIHCPGWNLYRRHAKKTDGRECRLYPTTCYKQDKMGIDEEAVCVEDAPRLTSEGGRVAGRMQWGLPPEG